VYISQQMPEEIIYSKPILLLLCTPLILCCTEHHSTESIVCIILLWWQGTISGENREVVGHVQQRRDRYSLSRWIAWSGRWRSADYIIAIHKIHDICCRCRRPPKPSGQSTTALKVNIQRSKKSQQRPSNPHGPSQTHNTARSLPIMHHHRILDTSFV